MEKTMAHCLGTIIWNNRSISNKHVYKDAKKHFKKADPLLYRAALEFEIEDLKQTNDLLTDIIWTIIGQQLSGKAADSIFLRFKALFKGSVISAARVLKIPDTAMRSCGISGSKIRAIKGISERAIERDINLDTLAFADDALVTAELTKVKGIGPWTAEMILMFSLGRTDVFSRGDLGLMKGIMLLHGWKKLPNDKKLDSIIETWSPYRTYAAKILWKIADKHKARIAKKR